MLFIGLKSQCLKTIYFVIILFIKFRVNCLRRIFKLFFLKASVVSSSLIIISELERVILFFRIEVRTLGSFPRLFLLVLGKDSGGLL